MKYIFFIILLVNSHAFGQNPQVVITFDDLPVVNNIKVDDNTIAGINNEILQNLKKHNVPALGLINEGRLYHNWVLDSARVKVLQLWIRYGMELGNHTKDHIDYNTHSIAVYGKNILDGEVVTNQLLKPYGKSVKYFRHPFLHRGNSKEKVDSLITFLREHNHVEAPVTMDNSDWIFAKAYDSLSSIDDNAGMQKLRTDFVQYMEQKLLFYEAQSMTILKRPIPQILILHDNSIDADCLEAILSLYEKHGYSFISMDQALQDPIYQSKDEFYKGAGISWIHRWAITMKTPRTVFKGEPVTPKYVMDLAKEREE